MGIDNKLVSIIIPTFNHAKYVLEAIDSVINQSYQNFDLIIIDDGSIDNTKEIIGEIISNNPDKKIRYFFQKNSGVSAARNKGIQESKGEYITFLDADDIYMNTFLEDMVVKINEGYDWVICNNYIKRINTKNGVYSEEAQKRDLDFSDECKKQMLIKDRIGTPDRIMVKKEIILKNNILFDQKLACFEDWEFYIQLICCSPRPGYVDKFLVVYRLRDDDTNATRIMKWNVLDYRYLLLKKWKYEFKKESLLDYYSEEMWDLARKFLKHTKNKKKFIKCMIESLTTSFSPLKKTLKNISN